MYIVFPCIPLPCKLPHFGVTKCLVFLICLLLISSAIATIHTMTLHFILMPHALREQTVAKGRLYTPENSFQCNREKLPYVI